MLAFAAALPEALGVDAARCRAGVTRELRAARAACRREAKALRGAWKRLLTLAA